MLRAARTPDNGTMSTRRLLVLVAPLLFAPAFARAQTPDIPEPVVPEKKSPAAAPAEEEDAAEEEDIPPPPEKAQPKAPARRTTAPAKASATEPDAAQTAPTKTAVRPVARNRRSENLRLSSTLVGETGLIRVVAAEAAAPGTLRMSFGLDFF